MQKFTNLNEYGAMLSVDMVHECPTTGDKLVTRLQANGVVMQKKGFDGLWSTVHDPLAVACLRDLASEAEERNPAAIEA